ncbi:MAG: hypothetical protein ACYDEJ_13260 [Desulfitobacteriaceae bacterium]
MEGNDVMKKLSILIGSISLILIVFIGMIVYLMTFSEPKITVTAEIKPITDLDYNRIKERTEPFIAAAKKDDFKRIYIEINYSEPLAIISNRKIEFDHLTAVLDKGSSNVINLSGGNSKQDNNNELIAFYSESAEVYLNEISEDDLKNLFNNHKIKISWDKFGTGKEERVYYLKDFIVVK